MRARVRSSCPCLDAGAAAGVSDPCGGAQKPLALLPVHRRLHDADPAAGGGQQNEPEEVGRSTVSRMLARAGDAALTPLALQLAQQLDGSAGGGYEAAVLWNDMNGVQRMGDGKLYFVMREQPPAAHDQGHAQHDAGGGLWSFSMQGYGVHAEAGLAPAGANQE